MVQLYFNKILDRTITIDNVPKLWRTKVQAKLDEYYDSIAEEIIEPEVAQAEEINESDDTTEEHEETSDESEEV